MEFLSGFQIWDAIDILIVAFLIYRVLLLLRGTRAVRVALGLLLVFAAYFVARFAGLRTLDWLLSAIFGYIVFAIIVLFQSELRRVLAMLGQTQIFRGFTTETPRNVLDDIVAASTAMAAERRGALIVFERGVGLRNYVDQGIQLDAVISYDLLFSIFHTELPLHDGAVIIQGGRIAAASCFLPLTTNPRLSRELGSRHRAAIGISEETDALALVVSEESGSISIALDGQLTRRLDAATLRRRLEESVISENEDEEEDRDRKSRDASAEAIDATAQGAAER